MSGKHHNPPAFPRSGFLSAMDSEAANQYDNKPCEGMTLRDYFAAAALPALVEQAINLDHLAWDATAEHAYRIADAMLEERK